MYRDDVLENSEIAFASLASAAGIRHIQSAADFSPESLGVALEESAEAHFFPALGIAVVSADSEQLQSLMSVAAAGASPILAIEPEYVFHALTAPATPQVEYLRGYRAAVDHLYDELVGRDEVDVEAVADAVYRDTASLTWGLQAARIPTSSRNGNGITIAVLDTGFDLQHPDFSGRPINGRSFIPGQTVRDGHGHGTHCTGTACGPQRPPSGVRRYGCAFGSSISIGKVLNDAGSSVGSSVLFGMNWAVSNRIPVISMSLGVDVDQVSVAFEQAGRRALQAGCLIVAAAGNNAQRSSGNFGFVGQPANSSSIMAVASLDQRLAVAEDSARSSTRTSVGGKVDIAAPGVEIFSSVPVNRGKHAIHSGTSMATPHVAGIAAMWCEATGRTGADLWSTLVQNARSIPGDVRDLGAGLAQAPE